MKKVGILGGGQLGRMLVQAAVDYPIELHILDSKDAPCSLIAHQFVEGDRTNYDDVLAFGRGLDVLTIEIENVNVDALEVLEQEGVAVYPQPRVIRLIQDKREQKKFYQEKGIPTADFILTDNREAVKAHENFLPAFHKLGKEGYDGKGVQRLDSLQDIDKAFDKASLLEKAVDVDKEISVIIARRPSGELRAFPPVELVFHPEFNLVDYLLAPAQIDEQTQKEAIKLARDVIESLDMIGLLAVEMFLDKSGNLLVNEVAPRPHNSGHHSVRAHSCSQFEQHLRAILDFPLGDTRLLCAAAMVNILGEAESQGTAYYPSMDKMLAIDGVYPAVYHKKTSKPSRKMGHITILGNTVEEVRNKVHVIKPLAFSAGKA